MLFYEVHVSDVTLRCRFNSQTNNINDGLAGGPLAIFNKEGKAIVISPYDNFMAASLWHNGPEGGAISWGIMGGVNEIPTHFTYSTLLLYDDGINNVSSTILQSCCPI